MKPVPINQLRKNRHDALLIIDVQKDFLPGGSLPVPHGDRIIPSINHYIKLFQADNLPIIASRDWHPGNHCSFRAQGGPWPPHCIMNTPGACFADSLTLPENVILVSKGSQADRDAYSAFQDTGLGELLDQAGVKRLFIGGLATDYCVQETLLSALQHPFESMLLIDAIQAVNLHPDDGRQALARMVAAGAVPVSLE